MTDNDLKDLLDFEAVKINNKDFINSDPVRFVHEYSDPRDIEIVALLCSTIAWGKRTMICRDADRMLSLMSGQPYKYVIEKGYEDLDDFNIHRTFFTRNLRYYLRGLNLIYSRYSTLEEFAAGALKGADSFMSWTVAGAINDMLMAANDGLADSRCLPTALANSALKRFNMALRWLVRDDGIVDIGLWKVIKPSQLYIPLDVHVANVSRGLGLLSRKSNDRLAVDELTKRLRKFNPEDPVIYDFALFGIGVTGRTSDVCME